MNFLGFCYSIWYQVILMTTTDQDCFVVKLQTSHETSHRKNNIGELKRWYRCNYNKADRKLFVILYIFPCVVSVTRSLKRFSLVDGAPPDSMTKLRKQTSRNRLQNQFTARKKNMLFAGSFRVSAYSRVKIKPVAETCSHYFLWCFFWCFLSTREATYAMSFIPISFPTLKRRRPEKKNVIYRARAVRMGKNCALGLEYSFFPCGPPAR